MFGIRRYYPKHPEQPQEDHNNENDINDPLDDRLHRNIHIDDPHDHSENCQCYCEGN